MALIEAYRGLDLVTWLQRGIASCGHSNPRSQFYDRSLTFT